MCPMCHQGLSCCRNTNPRSCEYCLRLARLIGLNVRQELQVSLSCTPGHHLAWVDSGDPDVASECTACGAWGL